MAKKKTKTEKPAREQSTAREEKRAQAAAARAASAQQQALQQLRAAVQAQVPYEVRKLLENFSGLYNEQIADVVLEIVSGGATLTLACDVVGVAKRHVMRWIARDDGSMASKYATALALQAEAWSDQILDLADNVVPEAGCVAAARLQIDTRRYLMGVNARGRFGERSTLTLEGNVNRPIAMITDKTDPHEAMRLYEETMRRYRPGVKMLTDESTEHADEEKSAA